VNVHNVPTLTPHPLVLVEAHLALEFKVMGISMEYVLLKSLNFSGKAFLELFQHGCRDLLPFRHEMHH